MLSTSSLLLHLGPLWLGVVTPDWVQDTLHALQPYDQTRKRDTSKSYFCEPEFSKYGSGRTKYHIRLDTVLHIRIMYLLLDHIFREFWCSESSNILCINLIFVFFTTNIDLLQLSVAFASPNKRNNMMLQIMNRTMVILLKKRYCRSICLRSFIFALKRV